MFQLLLVIIYLAFISLGLPDSLLGSAWPSMYGELRVPVSYAGIISMIIAAGTIISSIFSVKLIRKFETGFVTVISVAMTATALFGFATSHSFIQLCLWAIPYGLGAGSVDAALNNYVALHFKSKHMSWLHSFWGIGATVGPYIMGACLTQGLKWNSGYRIIGFIQIAIVLALFISLPLWKTQKNSMNNVETQSKGIGLSEAVKLPGAKSILTAFFCYCALESTTGLWASSYLVIYKGTNSNTAAKWAALFYLGITFGRFACGFVTEKFGDKFMIRCGQFTILFGTLFLFIPLGYAIPIGLVLVGLGCAPIYPSLLHATPDNFGAQNSQSIMGLQMACAYIGTTIMPPLFGVIAEQMSIRFFPWIIMILVVGMIVMVERMNKIHKRTD